METFLFISAIILTLTALIQTHRFNHNLARYMLTKTKAYPAGKLLNLMNTLGKWLTFLGGIVITPLVMALIFTPEGSPHWIITTGALGLLTLLIATLILTLVFTKHCLNRKLDIKKIILSICHKLLTKAKKLNWIKVTFWMSAIVLLITFLPFFVELVNFLVYVIGLVIAARLGLLDKLNNYEDEPCGEFYNYATRKFDYGYKLGGMYDHSD